MKRKQKRLFCRWAADPTDTIAAFRSERGLKALIGISGGASIHPVATLDRAFRRAEREIIREACRALAEYPVGVLTGGTKGGVPEIASRAAKRLGLTTVAVAPERAVEKVLPGISLVLIVGPQYHESRWGDESAVWASVCDAAIVLGGGVGTLTEMAHLMKINEAILRKWEKEPENARSEHPPIKPIAPMAGLGGVAEQLPLIWPKAEDRLACLPPGGRLVRPRAAVEWLLGELGLKGLKGEPVGSRQTFGPLQRY